MANLLLTTTTQERLDAKVVDTVFSDNVLAAMMLGKAEEFAGEKMLFPVMVEKPQNVGSFSGYDILDAPGESTDVNLEFEPRFVRASLSLAWTDLKVNATPEAKARLAARKQAQYAIALADTIGTQFYGDGTGNSGKDFLGLEALVDDGTSVATIGGQSRSTYTSLQSNTTASGGTLTLQQIRNSYDAAKKGSDTPTLGVTTEAIFSLVGGLLEQKARYSETGAKTGRAVSFGFETIKFRNMDIVADEKCTTGTIYFLNERYIGFYALQGAADNFDAKPINYQRNEIVGNPYGTKIPGMGFESTGFIYTANQMAYVNHIAIGGNLTTDNPNRHSKLTGITGT